MDERPLALLDARLYPPPPDGSDSVLLARGRISAIGRAAQIRAAAPAGARILELGSRTLSAGFHDAHCHFLQAGWKASRPSLARCRRLEDVYDAVTDAVRRFPERELLLLEGWDEHDWELPRPPERERLDQITRERAVLLRRVDDHTAVGNSRALRMLEATSAGGSLDWETGLCREGAVLRLEEFFPPKREDVRRAITESARCCFALGITTASEFVRPELFALCRQVLAEELPLSLDVYLVDASPRDPLFRGEARDSGRLRVRGVKFFADGSIGGRTAALHADYADCPGQRGRLLFKDAELQERIRLAHERELAVAVHAIGDRAIAQVVEAFARLPAGEVSARRHRIEHFEMPSPADIEKIARMGLRPCVQPNFLGRWGGSGGLYETALGRARTRAMTPLRSLLEARTGVFFGSDGMPASPLYGIRAAGRHPEGTQSLSPAEAHRLYTEEAAFAVQGERSSGRLAVGAQADLVAFEREFEDLARGPLAPPAPAEAALTIVAGRIVHVRGPLRSALERCGGTW